MTLCWANLSSSSHAGCKQYCTSAAVLAAVVELLVASVELWLHAAATGCAAAVTATTVCARGACVVEHLN
jgi:hypothetical protein